MHMRVPIIFNVHGVSPAQMATVLAERDIGVRDGNMYSPRLLTRLSIAPESDAVRASLAHYNSFEEVDRFLVHFTKLPVSNFSLLCESSSNLRDLFQFKKKA